MMRRTGIFIALLLLLGGGIFATTPFPAHASCAEIPPPDIAMKQSDAVFSGIVLSVKELNRSDARSSSDPVDVTFRVTEYWKGVRSDRVTIRTTAHIEGGVSRFEEGKPYLVYADKTLNGLRVGACTRTAELALAADDLAALGQGTVPPPSPELEESIRANPASMYLFWGGMAFAVVAAVAFAVLILRLRRRHG